ncbi:hypothetical protein D3C72_1694790 [compost metagenome]
MVSARSPMPETWTSAPPRPWTAFWRPTIWPCAAPGSTAVSGGRKRPTIWRRQSVCSSWAAAADDARPRGGWITAAAGGPRPTGPCRARSSPTSTCTPTAVFRPTRPNRARASGVTIPSVPCRLRAGPSPRARRSWRPEALTSARRRACSARRSSAAPSLTATTFWCSRPSRWNRRSR